MAYGATRQAANLTYGAEDDFLINDVVPLTLGTEIKVIEDVKWFVKLFRNPHASMEM